MRVKDITIEITTGCSLTAKSAGRGLIDVKTKSRRVLLQRGEDGFFARCGEVYEMVTGHKGTAGDVNELASLLDFLG